MFKHLHIINGNCKVVDSEFQITLPKLPGIKGNIKNIIQAYKMHNKAAAPSIALYYLSRNEGIKEAQADLWNAEKELKKYLPCIYRALKKKQF